MRLEEIIGEYQIYFGRDIKEEPYDAKGNFFGVKVVSGDRSIVFDFYDSYRLQQDLEIFRESEEKYLRFENIVVIKSVTRENILLAIRDMIKSGFVFELNYY